MILIMSDVIFSLTIPTYIHLFTLGLHLFVSERNDVLQTGPWATVLPRHGWRSWLVIVSATTFYPFFIANCFQCWWYTIMLWTCFLPLHYLAAILGGYRTISPDKNYHDQIAFAQRSEAVADIKFTYVVSCQVYGMQKKSSELRDRSCYQNILNLMLM